MLSSEPLSGQQMASPRQCLPAAQCALGAQLQGQKGWLVRIHFTRYLPWYLNKHIAPSRKGVFWDTLPCWRTLRFTLQAVMKQKGAFLLESIALELVGLHGALCKSICPTSRGIADLLTSSWVNYYHILDYYRLMAPRSG